MADQKKVLDYKDVEPFIPEQAVRTEWEGDKRTVAQVMNRTMAIYDFQIYKSSFGEGNYVSIQARDENNKIFWFNTGSEVVGKQLEEIGKENLPKKVKYIQPEGKRYHSLAQPDL